MTIYSSEINFAAEKLDLDIQQWHVATWMNPFTDQFPRLLREYLPTPRLHSDPLTTRFLGEAQHNRSPKFSSRLLCQHVGTVKVVGPFQWAQAIHVFKRLLVQSNEKLRICFFQLKCKRCQLPHHSRISYRYVRSARSKPNL